MDQKQKSEKQSLRDIVLRANDQRSGINVTEVLRRERVKC